MSGAYLPGVEVVSANPVQGSVIWLHGLGADGHDFEPVVPYLGLEPALGLRFVFPHAPPIPVTLNSGYVMPAWYDIRDLDLRGGVSDAEGLHRSAAQVVRLIHREIERGIPARRVVLAGFSQGGTVAFHVGLRFGERLAGLLGLSTYLADGEAAPAGAASPQGLPVFLAHGRFDPMVPFAAGEKAGERLRALGCDVRWEAYAMAHEVCPPELLDIGKWLTQVLGRDIGGLRS